jgi:hypothetical protein
MPAPRHAAPWLRGVVLAIDDDNPDLVVVTAMA